MVDKDNFDGPFTMCEINLINGPHKVIGRVSSHVVSANVKKVVFL